jgi:hypothetical protein
MAAQTVVKLLHATSIFVSGGLSTVVVYVAGLQNNPKTIKAAGTICMDVPSGTTSINQVKYRPFDYVRWGKNNVKVPYSPTEVAGVPANMQSLYRAECGDHNVDYQCKW